MTKIIRVDDETHRRFGKFCEKNCLIMGKFLSSKLNQFLDSVESEGDKR